jgi:hypothetical protein
MTDPYPFPILQNFRIGEAALPWAESSGLIFTASAKARHVKQISPSYG